MINQPEKFCIIALLLFCLSSLSAREKPNFVFFLIDDMGWSTPGVYAKPYHENPYYETPRIDQLAREGMMFTDAYAACTVCSPTRASIMTGKTPGRLHTTNYFNKKNGYSLSLEEVTLAEALKEAGYKNYFLGKWHLHQFDVGGVKDPEHNGFDVTIGKNEAGQPRDYFWPYHNNDDHPMNILDLEAGGGPGEYLTHRLTKEAVKLLEDGKENQPFMIYMSYYSVHQPIQVPDSLRSKYSKKTPSHGHNDPGFAGMVQSVDMGVGAIMDKLDELELADNTVIIFFSDNGGEPNVGSNYPLRDGKGWQYEGGVREPLIVRWPDVIEPGTTSDDIIFSTDFYPTMLEMAGVPAKPKQHIDGKSFLPVLKGHGDNWGRHGVFWHFPHGREGEEHKGSIRLGDFKMVEFFETTGTIELYNLAEDIGETRDLSEDTDYKDMRDLLLYELHHWRDTSNVEWVGSYKTKPTPTRPVIEGCTNTEATNFNVYATKDDGSCEMVGVERELVNPEISILYLSAEKHLAVVVPPGELYRVEIFDVLGKNVVSKKAEYSRLKIDMTGYIGGVYIVNVLTDSGYNTIKVMVN